MNVFKFLKEKFSKKRDTTGNTKPEACPNCWGYVDYTGKYFLFTKR